MRKIPKPSPTASPLLFELDPEPLQETLTALGGIPLVVQAFRSLGLPQSIQEHVRVKQRQRGYDDATFVESFVILNAAGGECVEDFERLRQDPGLAEMIGHAVPSPRAALEFLQAFHQEEKIEEAQQQRLPEQIAYIPEETPALEGLGRVNGDLVQRFGERTPDQRIATVDQDATIIESHKQQALTTYEGVRGYQPMLAVWAETGLVLADQFRDGNVPAQMEPLEVAQRAFAALPGTVKEYYYRGDSACHESGLVNWLRDEQRAGGPRGRIGFAISARMSEPLHAAIEAASGSRLGTLRRSASGRNPRVRRRPVCARGENGEEGFATAALRGHPHSPQARGTLRGRERGAPFRGVVEPVGVEAGALDRVAPRKGRHH